MNSLFYTKLALQQFRRNLTRSLLTGLGIVIGIAAVIIVISAGQGIKGFILAQFDQFGSNYIQTETRVPSTGNIQSGGSAQAQAFGTVVTTLTLDDMEVIRKLPNIKTNYAGQIAQAVAVSPNGTQKTVSVYATSSTLLDIDSGKIANGRFYNNDEDVSWAKVVVLGSTIATDLFGDADPVGQSVKIKQKNFKVIGVFESRGAALFLDLDSFVYIPIRTVQKELLGTDYIQFITSQYKDKSKLAETVVDIQDLLRRRHNIDLTNPDKDDFVVQTSDDVTNILDTIIGGLTLLLVALSAISLIVGGVGIMNIMYVSVLERTFEIGLRKALGARRDQILKQFLTEAVMITGLGGISGIIAGATVSFLISLVAQSQGYAWPFALPWYGVVLAVGFSTICGLGFGLYPARRAADLNPIEALRYE